MSYFPGTNAIDHTKRLGFHRMPDGYYLLQLDSGHFMWHRPETDEDSAIHWDKWAVFAWAKQDAAVKADNKALYNAEKVEFFGARMVRAAKRSEAE